MALAHSRLTAQGQVSVPAEVRRRLGIGPGSVIEWEQEGDKLVVRRAKKYTMQDLHSALFPDGPPTRKSDEELQEGIRKHMQRKHARR
jgi:antitoxin PrlF